MKTLFAVLGLALVAGLAWLASTFTAERLPVQDQYALALPEPRPPAAMKVAALKAGTMQSQALMAYRGGGREARTFGMDVLLVQHPQGTLLFDSGFGRNVDQHVLTTPWLMQQVSEYARERPVADQLQAAGIRPDGVVLTHSHWDHVSGLEDLKGVPVWVNQAEMDFINSGHHAANLVRSFGALPYKVYEFTGGAYLGFESSLDVFGDGSVVLVPAPGHTPGSVIAFIHAPQGQRYALVGDLVWQKEGIDLPAERPWLPRRLVDWDEQRVRGLITHMHLLQQAVPGLIVVPAHDRRVWEQLPSFGG